MSNLGRDRAREVARLTRRVAAEEPSPLVERLEARLAVAEARAARAHALLDERALTFRAAVHAQRLLSGVENENPRAVDAAAGVTGTAEESR